MKRLLAGTVAALAFAFLQGCASLPPPGSPGSVETINPADPFERFNRSMFSFNDSIDRAVIKPVATAYRDVTPALIRRGVTNFFGNITDMWSLVNNALQLKPAETTDNLFRVTVNTFWGLGGIFDVASDMNIPKHTEDFGLTLGHYGVASGPYLVLPLLGPSTLRDTVGSVVDMQGNVVGNIDDVPARNSLTVLRLVDLRANFLGAGDVLDQAALDKYSFARDVYLQRRRSLIEQDSEKEERYDLPETTPSDAASPEPAKSAK